MRPFLLTLLLCLALFADRDPAAAQRTLSWPEIAVQARLDADGRLHVRERQTMLFNGNWNGGERGFVVRPGQRIEIGGVSRIDPETRTEVPLTEGDLDQVDHYERLEDNLLRWRARAPGDPPFDNAVMSWVIDYTLWPVLEPLGDGRYRLSHDFLFADRAGGIDNFQLDLAWDPVWDAGVDSVHAAASSLPPSRGYTVEQSFRYTGAGSPAAVPRPAPAWAGGLAMLVALLAVPLALWRIRSRNREMEAAAPDIRPEAIDEAWLDRHLFGLRPEVAGAAWDHSVGSAEVAALLARLVAEEKLESRVDTGERTPILHLTRTAGWDAFEPHEQELLRGLFFDGGRETDTESIRDHYRKSGFNPTERIQDRVLQQVMELPGEGKVHRSWGAPLLVLIGGGLLATLGAVEGGWQLGLVAAVVMVTVTIVSAGIAAALSRRVVGRTGPAVGVTIAQAVGAVFLAVLASGLVDSGMPFLSASLWVLLGASTMLLASGWLADRMAQPTDTPERLAFRHRLAAAREFFERELDRPEPSLDDRWFPWLLAFGLGEHVDRWFREFGGSQARSHHAGVVVPTGRSGGGWTGGGPQFGGGGGFGGGGAGGAWGVAAAGMASGVSAPSSSSGGGGSASSGGGSGGGW